MGSAQPIPDYIKFGWGMVFYPNGQAHFGYGWYCDFPSNPGEKP